MVVVVTSFENISAFRDNNVPDYNGVNITDQVPTYSPNRMKIYQTSNTKNAFKDSSPDDIAALFMLAYNSAKDEFKTQLNLDLSTQTGSRVQTMPDLASGSAAEYPLYNNDFLPYITDFHEEYTTKSVFTASTAFAVNDIVYLTIPIAFTPPYGAAVKDFYLTIKYTITA
jgi:hypothetical protein